MIFDEIENLNKEKQVTLLDVRILTFNNKREVLTELSDLIDKSDLDIMLYIETRPEGINAKSIDLLRKLKVDGVGMGIELLVMTSEKIN